MLILPCAPPTGDIESAPLTDLALHIGNDGGNAQAFWAGDDAYVVRVEEVNGSLQWYQITAESGQTTALPVDDLTRMGELMESILPISTGRVAFPTGTSGRVVYRIWRSRRAGANARTRILGVRAARSHCLPA